jgi:mono/diheme cytochrome c family protein
MRKLIILTTVLLAACQTQADVETPDYSARHGEEVFAKHCATCHGASGEGIEPWYPSLQRLAAMREPGDMIETVITGRFRRGGELNGHTIPIMPAWGQLSDADVAAIVNYIQQNWGEGVGVSIQDVSATRARLWELD